MSTTTLQETNETPETILIPDIIVSKIEPLFFEYYKNRDKQVRQTLAVKNQPLVTYIVNKYYSSKTLHKTLREDLLQEGNIGLLSAIEGFDPTKGFRFSTYACVPLSTKILTRTGWKLFNEIQEGDETLGYQDGQSVWTKIQGVTTYKEAPLMKFGDSLWSAICTPQHKWLVSEEEKVSLKPLLEWPSSKQFEWPKKGKKRKKIELITSAPFVGEIHH